MSTTQIRQRLETLLEFMQPYWEFVNCHMVNYFTHKHWHRFIPFEIREEVPNSQRVRQCIEKHFWRQENHNAEFQYSAVAKFMETCEAHRLSNFNEILFTIDDLQRELGIAKVGGSSVSIKEFMTDKKRHEVELTAKLINDLIGAHNCDNDKEEIFIVDAGDGKGYLSSRLALQYGHKVLGVDANQMNTENALERSKKLQRAWNGLLKRAELIENGLTPPRRGKKSNSNISSKQQNINYYTTAKFIDSNLNLTELIQSYFPITLKSPIICLSGLHTCGNLASTCLRVFHAQKNCKLLCNIGCCYHFLNEAFTDNALEHSSSSSSSSSSKRETTKEYSFPMSNFLYEKQMKMGRNARMLAAQCIERTLNSQQLPNISLFYRALLDLLIERELPTLQNGNENIQVGRLRKIVNFPEYINQCANRTGFEQLNLVQIEKIHAIELEYNDERAYLELFYLLRMLFAPILETLILLDRLLYLRELGYGSTYIVSVFDAIVSPRHFAIVAIKGKSEVLERKIL